MTIKGFRALTLAAALAAGTASVAYAADPMVGGAPMIAQQDRRRERLGRPRT